MVEQSVDANSREEFDFLLSRLSELYHSGRTRLGLEISAGGVNRARELGDSASLRKMLTAHGIFQSDLHNLPQALQFFSEALDLCNDLGDPIGYYAVWVNISGALSYAEFPHFAISAARVAAKYAEQIAEKDARRVACAVASHNVAYGCLFANEYALGLRAARFACTSLDPRHANRNRLGDSELPIVLLSLVTNARLLLRVNMIDEARACLLRAEALARDAQSLPRIALVVEMSCALLDTYRGDFDQGAARLLEVSRSQTTPSPVLVTDALRFLVEAHLAAKQPDRAAEYMRQLAKLMQNVRCEDVLFHHGRRAGWFTSITELEPARHDAHHGERQPFRLARMEQAALAPSLVLDDICTAAELHDDPSGMHPHRVGELARLLALRSGIDHEESDRIAKAAKLHDVGKVGIPPSILQKKGPLNASETEIMRWHTTNGAELLSSAHIDNAEIAVAVARHHHEWWSGAGYPDGLANTAIPIGARITGITEAFDAMTHDRPYRPHLSIASALDVLEDRAGFQFDPKLARMFCELVHKLHHAHGDLDRHLERNARPTGFLQAKQRVSDGMACFGH